MLTFSGRWIYVKTLISVETSKGSFSVEDRFISVTGPGLCTDENELFWKLSISNLANKCFNFSARSPYAEEIFMSIIGHSTEGSSAPQASA